MMVVLAVFAAGCTSAVHKAGDASASPPARASAAVAVARAITPASMMTALAAAGIATVADESSSTPQVHVAGPSVLTVTAWQATNMAEEAASGGGVAGGDLDAMLPMPAQS